MTGNGTVPDQTLILLVGPPASGKTTLAKLIIAVLKAVKHFDIDDIRLMLFGHPVPNDGTDPEIKRRDDNEMAGTYKGLFGTIEAFLRAEHPLLVTFTLSNKEFGQKVVRAIWDRYPNARIRVIWCWPELNLDELAMRMEERAATGYVGATTSPSRAWELREKYHFIGNDILPHLKLDTGPRHEVGESLQEALAYILNPQPHDHNYPVGTSAVRRPTME